MFKHDFQLALYIIILHSTLFMHNKQSAVSQELGSHLFEVHAGEVQELDGLAVPLLLQLVRQRSYFADLGRKCGRRISGGGAPAAWKK